MQIRRKQVYNIHGMYFRFILFFAGIAVIALLGFSVVQYAQGLRFDTKSLKFTNTGILSATSNPDGAQVRINGKLKTATNDSINLAPDTYDIEISKEGYFGWRKRITIKASEVSKTEAILFPRAASLSPVTFDGAKNPFLSPDGTKLLWIVPPITTPTPETKVGLWVLELANLPFGFARTARLVTDMDLSNAKISWSPDERNVLVEKPNGIFLIDIGSLTKQESLVSLSKEKVSQLRSSWDKEEEKQRKSHLTKLPEFLQDLIVRKASSFVFSPDEAKVLYIATSNGSIPEKLIPTIPGTSTQKESRDIESNHIYIYDIKEDRNFELIDNAENLTIKSDTATGSSRKISWLGNRHILLAQDQILTIIEYDGTNKIDIWTGSYEAPFAFPTPNLSQLVILTKLGATNGALPNLYAINLR